MQTLTQLDLKLERLREKVRGYGSCIIAYSGGVDSVFLAHIAHQVLGSRALAVIADTPSLPRRELDDALTIAKQFSFPVWVAQTTELQNADYVSNPLNRCYFCKHELFLELKAVARARRFAVIVYGENASDLADFRAGVKAAEEFEVRAPLKEVGLTKTEIRELSARLGLPTADKPQMACLSSRIPHGEIVSAEKLKMIEAAENILRDLGFHDVRVRHHEFENRKLARIEVGKTELPKILINGTPDGVALALKKIGYSHVTIDLEGYRRPAGNG